MEAINNSDTQQIAEEIVSDLIAAQAAGLQAPAASDQAEAEAAPRCPHCNYHRYRTTKFEALFQCSKCGSYYGPQFNLKLDKRTRHFRNAISLIAHGFICYFLGAKI